MAISSIHFQKATSYAIAHNFRESEERKMPKYHLPKKFHDERGNEFWRPDRTPEQIFEEEVSKFSRKGGRIPKFENAHREAVINLNEHHTLKDLLKVKEHFERKYRFICCGIALHRDEGHIEEVEMMEDLTLKRANHNFHAHINFITYANGKQQWKFGKKELAQMQTEVAEILGMERGKEFSKAKRLNHYQYRYLKQKEEEKGRKLNRNEIFQHLKEVMNCLKEKREAKGEGFLDGFDLNELFPYVNFDSCDFLAVKNITRDKSLETENKIMCKFLDYCSECNKRDEERQEKEQEIAQKLQNSSQAIENLKNELKTLENENNGLKSEINMLKFRNQAQEIQENNKLEALKEENRSLKEENNRLLSLLEILNNLLIWLGIRKKGTKCDTFDSYEIQVSKLGSDKEHSDWQTRNFGSLIREAGRYANSKEQETTQKLQNSSQAIEPIEKEPIEKLENEPKNEISTKSNQYHRYQNNRGGGRGR